MAKIQDVSSLGRSIRQKGIKTNRQHEFLSDLKRNHFLIEYSDFISGIREQFPLLLLEETIVLVDELGLKHPTDPKTNERYLQYIEKAFKESDETNIIEILKI